MEGAAAVVMVKAASLLVLGFCAVDSPPPAAAAEGSIPSLLGLNRAARMDSDHVEVEERGEGCKLLLLLGEVDDGVVLVVIGRGEDGGCASGGGGARLHLNNAAASSSDIISWPGLHNEACTSWLIVAGSRYSSLRKPICCGKSNLISINWDE